MDNNERLVVRKNIVEFFIQIPRLIFNDFNSDRKQYGLGVKVRLVRNHTALRSKATKILQVSAFA